uniref:Trypsin-4 n=2 Tax=Lygus hesperus TaxID=30085 RepID=A0A0A9XVJ0_LYGHE
MIFCTTLITSFLLASFVQGGDPVSTIPIKRAPYKSKPHSLMIRSGSGTYNQGGGLHEVDKIVIHSDFHEASSNQHLGKGNLALLKIFFSFHPSLTVAQIPTPHHVTTENTTAHIVAWPIVSGKNTKALKVESTRTVNWEKCQELYSSKTTLDITTLCTQKLSMKAQEGNALISRAKLIGLLISPNSLKMEFGVDVYVDTASYKLWIDEIIAGS